MDDAQRQKRIAELRRKSKATAWDLSDVMDRMRTIKSRALVDVADARDERGKPRYPSERVRDAAVQLMLSENLEYLELRTRRRTLEFDSEEIETQLRELYPDDDAGPFFFRR